MEKIFNCIIFILIFLILITCSDDNLSGPCDHTYKEPILHISTVQDTQNNKNIRFVKLRDLKINGILQTGTSAIIESYSIVSDDSIFYCNVPFGFGYEEGTYEFIMSIEGYKLKHIVIDSVSYSIFEGGCPSFNDGGKRVEITLN